MKKRFSIRQLLIFTTVVAVYLQTWIGGYRTHAQQQAAESQRIYNYAVERNRGLASQFGAGFQTDLHEGGPRSGVNWCVPILPGVLLVDSYWSTGGLSGKGGTKIVLYYVTGSFTVCELSTWRS